MTADERNDFLYGCVLNCVAERLKNKVYMRDNPQSLAYAEGRLNGVLTSFELDMIETPLHIIIKTHKGKEVLRYPLN